MENFFRSNFYLHIYYLWDYKGFEVVKKKNLAMKNTKRKFQVFTFHFIILISMII